MFDISYFMDYNGLVPVDTTPSPEPLLTLTDDTAIQHRQTIMGFYTWYFMSIYIYIYIVTRGLLCGKSPALQWRHKMRAMVSQITGVLTDYSFVQAQINENMKAPRHWPLWGEITGNRWIPHIKGQ